MNLKERSCKGPFIGDLEDSTKDFPLEASVVIYVSPPSEDGVRQIYCPYARKSESLGVIECRAGSLVAKEHVTRCWVAMPANLTTYEDKLNKTNPT